RRAGATAGEADLLTRLAETEVYADCWTAALAFANDARSSAQQEGQENANPARRAQAMALSHLGRLSEARAMLEEGLASSIAANDDIITIAYLQSLVFVASSEGRWADVEAMASRSSQLLAAISRVEPLRLDATPERIEALVALGRLEEADAHLAAFSDRAR